MNLLKNYLNSMFGMAGNTLFGFEIFWYLKNYSVVLLTACILSFPIYPWLTLKVKSLGKPARTIISIASILGFVALFLLSTAYLVNDTYNPFLYFRF